jgi:hypothetical protein
LATFPPPFCRWYTAESSCHWETIRPLAHIHRKGAESSTYFFFW